MRKIIFLILCVLAAVACQKDIEIPLDSKGGRLYLECFPSNDSDTTFIKLKAATPVKEKDALKELNNIDIQLSANGNSHKAGLLSEQNHVYTYFVLAPLRVGDEVTVRASADGYPAVTASSTIPAKPEISFTRELSHYASIKHTFRIQRDGNNGEVHYYGVCIDRITAYETTYTDPAKEAESDEEWESCDCDAETSLKTSDGSKRINSAKVNGRNMVVFEDDGGASKEVAVTLSTGFYADMLRAYSPEYKRYRRTRYNIQIFRLAKAEYEHLNPQRNNLLVGTGLLPPFTSYGNVSGGYGIMSCMGRKESGWLPNLSTE